MKIVHITNTISKKGGGIAAVVANIARNQKSAGHSVKILVFSWGRPNNDTSDGGIYADLDGEVEEIDLKSMIISIFKCFLGFTSVLEEELHSSDLIHRHGLWSPISCLGLFVRKDCKSYVLSPHGFLNREALKMSLVRKRIFIWVIERINFRKSVAVIVSSNHEFEEVSRFDWASDKIIKIIPNGVGDEFYHEEVIGSDVSSAIQLTKKKQFLYLGAIERIKGIDTLLKAVNRSSECLRERSFNLLCVGDGSNDYKQELTDYVASNHLEDLVTFSPGIYGDERIKIYQESWFFVSLSHSENFGITIAESLVLGVPVIVSSNLPWAEISIAGAGIVVEPEVEAVKGAFVRASSVSDVEYNKYSNNAVLFSREKFHWDVIGSQFIKAYTDIVSKGKK